MDKLLPMVKMAINFTLQSRTESYMWKVYYDDYIIEAHCSVSGVKYFETKEEAEKFLKEVEGTFNSVSFVEPSEKVKGE